MTYAMFAFAMACLAITVAVVLRARPPVPMTGVELVGRLRAQLERLAPRAPADTVHALQAAFASVERFAMPEPEVDPDGHDLLGEERTH